MATMLRPTWIIGRGAIRPPLQGSDVFPWQTQGAALGCDGSSRWDSKPFLTKPTLEQQTQGPTQLHDWLLPMLMNEETVGSVQLDDKRVGLSFRKSFCLAAIRA